MTDRNKKNIFALKEEVFNKEANNISDQLLILSIKIICVLFFLITCLTANIFMFFVAYKIHKNEGFNAVSIVPEVLSPALKDNANKKRIIQEVVIDEGMPGGNLSDKVGEEMDFNVKKTPSGIELL